MFKYNHETCSHNLRKSWPRKPSSPVTFITYICVIFSASIYLCLYYNKERVTFADLSYAFQAFEQRSLFCIKNEILWCGLIIHLRWLTQSMQRIIRVLYFSIIFKLSLNFFIIWLDVPQVTYKHSAQDRIASMTRAILHISCLAANTTLNIYKPM